MILKYEIKSWTTLIKSAFALLSPEHLNKKVVWYKWHYTDPDPTVPINQKICSEPTDQTAQKYLYVIQLLGPSSTSCHILKLIACLPMASSEMITTSPCSWSTGKMHLLGEKRFFFHDVSFIRSYMIVTCRQRDCLFQLWGGGWGIITVFLWTNEGTSHARRKWKGLL